MSWKWERSLVHIPRAKLVVSPKDWSVEAYFPGPDLRYSGTRWTLAPDRISGFVEELEKAWFRLEELERLVSGGANFNVDAAMGIRIIVSGWPGRGVTVHQHHGLLRSEEHVRKAVAELAALHEEALEVQRLLNSREPVGRSQELPQ